MQALYGYEQMNEHDVPLLQKNLFNNIRLVYHLFLYQLQVLVKTSEYAKTDALIRAAKHLPSEEDKNFSIKFFNNKIISFLRENAQFNDLLKKEKLTYEVSDDLCKSLYLVLKKSDAYKQYLSKPSLEIKDEKDILLFLIKEVMLASELLEHHLEDLFSSWLDDKDVVIQSVINFIKDFSEEKNNQILKELSENLNNEAEEIKFARDLMDATILHKQQLKELISPKLVNWDVDRIAKVDLILLKMALCEMLYFDSIPVKVSINEYIDISKLYSTPQSREFINGVLDKLMKELREEGKIVKKGRGLME